jgi:hypothetical protein
MFILHLKRIINAQCDLFTPYKAYVHITRRKVYGSLANLSINGLRYLPLKLLLCLINILFVTPQQDYNDSCFILYYFALYRIKRHYPLNLLLIWHVYTKNNCKLNTIQFAVSPKYLFMAFNNYFISIFFLVYRLYNRPVSQALIWLI